MSEPVTTPEPVAPETALGQTSLEHDGRVYTGIGTDDVATDAAFSETTVGKKAEADPNARPTRGQRRFDRLTKEREDAKREADALKAELDAIKAKAVAEPKVAPAKPAPDAPKAEPVKAKTDRPKLEDFLSHENPIEAFDDALAKYHEAQIADQIDARLSSRLEAERASRALNQTFAEVTERGKAAYPDFEDVRSKSDVKVHEAVLWEILHDPNAEHIHYAIATNPDAAQAFVDVKTPIELGRLLVRYGSVTESAAPASPAVRKSQAPRPFQPVSGASRTASPSHEELAEAGDYDRYKAKRHSEMGVSIR